MRRSSDFASVVRRGARARTGRLIVHQQLDLAGAPPVVGLVVGRSVGGSVVRHRVSRRLRAQLAQRLQVLPAGSGTVVRALPHSAEASSAELGAALDTAFARLAGKR
jgi:ribonuclease P protein component